MCPSLARDDLQKLTTTVTKVAGYLEKSGAKQWWAEWLEQAKQISESDLPVQPCDGKLTSYVNLSLARQTLFYSNVATESS